MDLCIYDRFEECCHSCKGCPKADNDSEHEYYKELIFRLYRERSSKSNSKPKS